MFILNKRENKDGFDSITSTTIQCQGPEIAEEKNWARHAVDGGGDPHCENVYTVPCFFSILFSRQSYYLSLKEPD